MHTITRKSGEKRFKRWYEKIKNSADPFLLSLNGKEIIICECFLNGEYDYGKATKLIEGTVGEVILLKHKVLSKWQNSLTINTPSNDVDIDWLKLAQILKQKRIQLNLKVEDVANRLNIQVQTVRARERSSSVFTFPGLLKYVELYEINIDELVGECLYEI